MVFLKATSRVVLDFSTSNNNLGQLAISDFVPLSGEGRRRAMRFSHVFILLSMAYPGLGCSVKVPSGSESHSTSESHTSSAAEATSTGPQITSSSTGTDGTVSGGASTDSIIKDDLSDGIIDCTTWNDKCPEGMKCLPYDIDGVPGSPEAQGCFPVAKNPDGLGEPCQTLGYDLSGMDSCENGMLCWSEDNQNRCMPLCQGSPPDFTCPEDFACLPGSEYLPVCLPACHPFSPDCPPDEICAKTQITFFQCAVPWASKTLFEECLSSLECSSGICIEGGAAVECQAGSCCGQLCDVTEVPGACAGMGQECVSLFSKNEGFPSYVNLGVCSIP